MFYIVGRKYIKDELVHNKYFYSTLIIIAGMFFEIAIVPFVIIIATFFIDPILAITLLITIPLSIPIYKWSRKATTWQKPMALI
jgi:ABC-type transport system involved in cytochrome bd biosynthesis fused ATPase/permease subunit